MTLGAAAMKNVLIMGASYGGGRAARLLAEGLPQGHANHLYVLPRYAVISGYEDKAFVPYTSLFGPAPDSHPHPHVVIHGTIRRLERKRVTYVPAVYDGSEKDEETTLEFEYAVYALGAQLPAPIDLWGATDVFSVLKTNAQVEAMIGGLAQLGIKRAGIEWLRKAQLKLEGVRSVLVVGGGALGIRPPAWIEFATDLKDVYPSKSVTLLHSRERLLPKFVQGMHDEINKTMEDLGITMLLGQRLDLRTTLPENAEYNERGERIVKTILGRAVAADLVLLCTGQRANTDLIGELESGVVDEETGMIRVLPSLQISQPEQSTENQKAMGLEETDLSHIFAIGDAADAFGAIKAGHTAWYQGEVAAKNILVLIEHARGTETKPPQLIRYQPGSPAIKVSLGMKRYVAQSGPDHAVAVGEDGKEDLDAAGVWPFWGANYEQDKDK
ncbi:hypothetical protein FRC07_007338 [Ceratobasidium sp. 392]|nr:hypothetical protein FRC07_007338 [Ceratobasidium sp. 392]